MLRALWQNFLDALFPFYCFRCGVEGHTWCFEPGRSTPWPLCFTCRKNYHPNQRLGSCEKPLPLVRLGDYREPRLRQAIHDWKYEGQWALGKDWGRFFISSLKKLNDPAQATLVPIPLHWSRQLARGYNQSELLATSISKSSHLPTRQLLIRQRRTRPQAQLPLEERLTSLTEAFSTRANPPQTIWLVDDVVTSGTTITQAMQTLRKDGHQVVGILCLAVANPHDETKIS